MNLKAIYSKLSKLYSLVKIIFLLPGPDRDLRLQQGAAGRQHREARRQDQREREGARRRHEAAQGAEGGVRKEGRHSGKSK